MYERFTDRARKVMQLANQECQRLNHEAIGTEHMLVGLVKEGTGVAANVLKNLDIDLRKIRMEVERLVAAGPDVVSMGKMPQTTLAKNAIGLSIKEAELLGNNWVGTEHLLLGLIAEGSGVAWQILTHVFGLKIEAVRQAVKEVQTGRKATIEPDTSVSVLQSLKQARAAIDAAILMLEGRPVTWTCTVTRSG